jgi:hypothetical protein
MSRLVAGVLAVAILGFTAFRVSRAGSATRIELRKAEQTLATFDDWRRRYQPAVAAESISWQRTWDELQQLGVLGDERLSLTRNVARAAETAGLRDVRVLIQAGDTTGSDARLSTEGVGRKAAPFGLSVESRGDLRAVLSFLAQLPPSVAPTQLSLVRQDGRGRHRFVLAVYELTFANGPQPVRSSLERGAAGLGGDGRPGS